MFDLEDSQKYFHRRSIVSSLFDVVDTCKTTEQLTANAIYTMLDRLRTGGFSKRK
jgi:hypothetical protein